MRWNLLILPIAIVSLALSPAEKSVVSRAKEYIVHAQAKAQEQELVIQETDQENARLDQIAQGQETQIVTLSGQIDQHYKNEEQAVKYNQYAKPIIDKVNSYWGLGAFAYGFKLLAKHLFVLGIVLAIVGVILWFFAPAALAAVGLAFRAVKGVLSKVVGSVTNIIRRKK